MKRRTMHTGFALLSVIFGVVAVVNLYALQAAKSVDKAIASIEPESDDAGPAKPVAQLAWANALSSAGRFEAAETAYNELIRRFAHEKIGQAAQFNLANSYLRKGMQKDLDPAQARLMVELAKQRYRDLLRVAPGDWDARHNLERALRLAPESATRAADEHDRPKKSVNVIVPDFKIRDLP